MRTNVTSATGNKKNHQTTLLLIFNKKETKPAI
jgi:hypothetical protein